MRFVLTTFSQLKHDLDIHLISHDLPHGRLGQGPAGHRPSWSDTVIDKNTNCLLRLATSFNVFFHVTVCLSMQSKPSQAVSTTAVASRSLYSILLCSNRHYRSTDIGTVVLCAQLNREIVDTSSVTRQFIDRGANCVLTVPYRHRGGRIKKINAWYLNTLMVYL